jgi:transcriptional regulator with XRE-family HTH domain
MPEILKEFGKRIKYLRIKRKLSQEKLAELADMHRTYIGQIESGTRNVALKNVEKLANALEVPIKNLF